MISKNKGDLLPPTKNFNVLIAGYINVNVIDGSAFFLAGICGMFAQQPFVNVTFISANPVVRPEVMAEVQFLPNVDILDPYSNTEFQELPQPVSGDSMKREKYAELIGIAASSRNIDSIIIRDTETAFHFAKKFPNLVPKLALYVTGISSLSDSPNKEIVKQTEFVARGKAKLLCQTTDMAKILASSSNEIPLDKIGILSPHIPDSEGSFDELYHHSENPSRLAYTGKFFKAWNADAILAGFKAVNQQLHNLQLDVAGDQFKRDSTDGYFVDNVSYLLKTTEGVIWHGRVPRKDSRNIIANAHVGIGWRGPELDSSTELSTKILEYGALARPSILNRTELHERLLGKDYPLFVNSMGEYKALLSQLSKSKDTVELAAKRCFDLAQSYTYSAILPQLVELISPPNLLEGENAIALSNNLRKKIADLGGDLNKTVDARIEGIWFIWKTNPTSDLTLEDRVLVGEVYLSSWKKFTNKLQEKVAHEASEPKVASTKFIESKELVKRPTSTVSTNSSTEIAIQKLKSENESLERALRIKNARLDALSKSKLGRFQLMYWRKFRSS